MTWKEFAELARTVFVQVASREYGIRGRQTNVSRVAILTGIGRREVGKIRQAMDEEGPPLPNQTTDATRVLSGWHQDPQFIGMDGIPHDLTISGSGPSFEELARRYAPDVPPSTMLKELRRVGAVTDVGAGGALRVTRRYYQPSQLDAQWILNAGSVFADLGANINHNLGRRSGDGSWFLGRATDDRIEVRAVPEFQAFLEKEGQQFLERVDAWLTAHRAAEATPPAETRKITRLGVGLFMIKGETDKQTGK
ncbi:MAG: hypothetical protein FJ197_02060 [Gammaproteobacteria bacterium]|nr:hypothetical protein [Gammaproteobacteria bacterium]